MAFAGMSMPDKWVQAFFNATCPRTAGFTSIGLTSFSLQSLLLMLLLMFIGGAAQSTAGGVKVNAFAAGWRCSGGSFRWIRSGVPMLPW